MKLLAFFPVFQESLFIPLLVTTAELGSSGSGPAVENMMQPKKQQTQEETKQWEAKQHKAEPSLPTANRVPGSASPGLHGCGSTKARTSKLRTWESDQWGSISQHLSSAVTVGWVLQIGATLSVQEGSENWTWRAGQLPKALTPESCQSARAWGAPKPLSYHFPFICKITGSQGRDSARSISFHFWRAPGRNVSLLSLLSLSCRELKRDGTREYCTKCNPWPLDEGCSH